MRYAHYHTNGAYTWPLSRSLLLRYKRRAHCMILAYRVHLPLLTAHTSIQHPSTICLSPGEHIQSEMSSIWQSLSSKLLQRELLLFQAPMLPSAVPRCVGITHPCVKYSCICSSGRLSRHRTTSTLWRAPPVLMFHPRLWYKLGSKQTGMLLTGTLLRLVTQTSIRKMIWTLNIQYLTCIH